MASRVFLFFTPSDASLVRNWFACSEPRTPVACGEIGLRGFPAAFLPMAEVVDEA